MNKTKKTVWSIVFLTMIVGGAYIFTVMTTKKEKEPPTSSLCVHEGLEYSQGAVIATPKGRMRCENGKWVSAR